MPCFLGISAGHENLMPCFLGFQALANVIRRQRVTIELWDYDYSLLNSVENDDPLGR